MSWLRTTKKDEFYSIETTGKVDASLVLALGVVAIAALVRLVGARLDAASGARGADVVEVRNVGVVAHGIPGGNHQLDLTLVQGLGEV